MAVRNTQHADGAVTLHFVLVTGIDGNTFYINDPAYPGDTTLNAYANDFELRGYVSDPTSDLSELYVSSSSSGAGLNLAVGNAQSLVTGLASGTSQPVNDIANAVYFTDGPVEDLTGNNPGTTTTQFVYISQPGPGNYEIEGSGTTDPSQLQFVGVANDGAIQSQQSVMVQSTSGNPLVYPLYIEPTFTVVTSTAPQSTSLSAVTASETGGGTATLSATLTSDGLPLAGKTVGFSLNEGGTVTSVGTAATNANGIATLTGVKVTGFLAGTYFDVVGTSFAGDSSYDGSNASGTLNVLSLVSDQVALTSSDSPSLTGELITFAVVVNPIGDTQAPTGTVQFQIDGVNLGAPVTLADDEATSVPVTSLTAGTHTITAVYSGNATYPAETVSLTQTVENLSRCPATSTRSPP